jgi:hypothetical protein
LFGTHTINRTSPKCRRESTPETLMPFGATHLVGGRPGSNAQTTACRPSALARERSRKEVNAVQARQFIIYADRRLQRPDVVAEIATLFAIARGTFIIRSDAHYRT